MATMAVHSLLSAELSLDLLHGPGKHLHVHKHKEVPMHTHEQQAAIVNR